MPEPDDSTLLQEYVVNGSQAAFATLVERHVNKVYSVALRLTRNPDHAQEITQAVFVILAKKSRTMSRRVVLAGWLYETARLTAVTFARSELRRVRRQEEAHMQNLLNESETDVWLQIAPLLDAAMANLSELERHAVVLRFFDGLSMREVGRVLGASEDAAKKRVHRAVEKLRLFFNKRSVFVPAAVLIAAISANSVQAAPAVLAKTAAAVAVTKGTAVGASTLPLIKETLKLMAWTKAKLAVVTSATVILVVGTTTTWIAHHDHQIKLQTESLRSSWAFAGNTDPVSTLKTIMWAESRGDGRTLLASMTPDLQQSLHQRYGKELAREGITLEEMVARTTKAHADKNTGYYIFGRQVVSNQVLLRVWIKGENRQATFKMRKIGAEWKLDEQFLPDY